MKIFPLASSSSGNATLIESSTEGNRMLIDCGVTLKFIKQMLPKDKLPQAIFVTHEHSDHLRGVGPVARNLKIPIYIHKYAYNAKKDLLKNCKIYFLEPSKEELFGNFKIIPFSTKHDCMYSLGFIVEEISYCHNNSNNPKLCFLGDTGMITRLMLEKIKSCNSFFIEADYDVEELEKYADYSDELKERIASNVGHLSNNQAINLIKELDLEKIKLVILGHLSPRTNSPEKIRNLLKQNFPDYINKFKLAPLIQPIEIL